MLSNAENEPDILQEAKQRHKPISNAEYRKVEVDLFAQ
jgi:hypothetical protein